MDIWLSVSTLRNPQQGITQQSHLQGVSQALVRGQRWVGESQQLRQDGRSLDIWLSVSTLRNPQQGITQQNGHDHLA